MVSYSREDDRRFSGGEMMLDSAGKTMYFTG